MRALVRFMLLLVVAGVCAPGPAAAQASREATATAGCTPATRAQTLDRFRVLVIRDGLVLTPRRGDGKTIEVSNGSIAIDGTLVSGRELRDRLGADAALVLQLSYSIARRPACRLCASHRACAPGSAARAGGAGARGNARDHNAARTAGACRAPCTGA